MQFEPAVELAALHPADLRRRVFRLAWPVILDNLLQTLLGIVDTIMVGRLGANALAGVGTAQQFLFFIIAILSAVSIGSSILEAHAVGAGDQRTASAVAKQSLIWAIVIATPLAILGTHFSNDLMRMIGVSDAVVAIGGGYLAITMATSVVLVLPFTVGAVLRGAGDSRTPLLATTCANVVNVIVAYALIFGQFGAPALGSNGSAWGAAAGRLVSCGILIGVLLRSRTGVTLRGRQGWRPEAEIARRVVGLGAPAALEQVVVSAGFTFLAVVVARLGTDALAAQRIVGNVLGLSLLPGFGFGIAATALVGQSLGAGRPAEGEQASYIAALWAVIWMGVVGALFIVLRTPISTIFTNDPAIVEISAACLLPLGLSQPIWAVGFVLSGALRGGGNTRFPLLMSTVSVWGTILLGVLTTSHFGMGLPTVWAGFLIFGPIASIGTWWRFRRGDWKQLRLHAP